jgi:PAS domain S-box-containing protein
MEPVSSKPSSTLFTSAWWATMGFVLLALLWLGLGHAFLRYWIDDPELRFRVVLISSGGFVLVGATVLHGLLRRLQRRSREAESGRQAQQLLATLAEGSSDAIFAKDREGTYLLVNQATARLFHQSPEALVGAGDSLVFPPDQVARIRADDLRVMEGESNVSIEELIPTTQGVRTFLTTKGPLRNARGETFGLFGIARDITERAAVKAQLEESERRYRELFDSSPIPKVVFDVESLRFLSVNDEAVRHYGYSRDEFLGMTMLDIRPSEEHERFKAEVARLRTEQDIPWRKTGRWTHKLKDGCFIQVEVASSDVTFQGRPARMALFRDVTAQVELEQQRQQALAEAERSRDLLFSVLDRVDDGFVALDKEWRFTYVNQRAATMLGKDKPEVLLHRQIWAEFPEIVDGPIQQAFLRAAETQKLVSMQSHYARLNRWFEYRAYPSQAGLTIYFDDITERMRVQGVLADQEREYRLLAEQMPALIYRAALDGSNRTLFVSQHIRLLGYTPEQWLADSTSWIRAVHPDDLKRVVAALPTASSAHGEAQIEYRMRDGLGNWRHFRDSSRRVHPVGESDPYLQGVSVDITDLIEADQALKDSEARLRHSEQRYRLAAAHGTVWDGDFSTGLVNLGDDFWRRLGFDPVPIHEASERLKELIHPQDQAMREKMLIDHVTRHTPYDLEFRIRNSQGDWRWIHSQGQAMWDETGRAVYMAGTSQDVTTRIEALRALEASEARLRQSEQRYRLAASNGMVWDWDLEDNQLNVGGTFFENLGHPSASGAGVAKQLETLMHPDDRPKWQQAVRNFVVDGVPYEVQFRARDAQGNWHWFHTQGSGLRNTAGRVTYMAGTTVEITARVEAEEALKQSEARLRASEQRYRLAAARGSVWDWDIETGQLHVGDDFWRFLGHPPPAPQDSPARLAELMDPADRLVWQRALREHLAQRQPYDLEYRIQGGDGRWLWLHTQGQAVWNPQGRATYMAGTTVDITGRKTAQAALEASEAYRRNLFEQLSDGVLLIGPDRRVLDANPQAWNLLGRTRESLLASSLPDLLAEQELGRIDHLGIDTQELAEWTFARNDGAAFPAEISTSALDESRFLVVLRDISQRRQSENALLTYQLELSELTHQLLMQEKQTSQRIAQALHDRVGQTLAVARLHLDGLMNTVQNQIPSVLESQCQGMDHLIEQAVHEVRDVLRDLRPPLLEEAGLVAALDNEIASPAWALGGADLLLEVDDALGPPQWPADVEYAAFMVAREAITNALQHGQPTLIRVVLGGGQGVLRLDVIDDGTGIPANMVKGRAGHLGVVGMRERTIAIGARFSMTRVEEGGTRVSLRWEASRT